MGDASGVVVGGGGEAGGGERWGSAGSAALLERPTVAPIAPGERIASMDVLRGVALLGILPMNLQTGFALVAAAYFNPAVDGGFDGANRAVWLGTHVIFDMKMMAIFSMLFGAGLVVMTERADAAGAPLAGRYYRRLGWLALIGFLHAYLLWFGDILFMYALCGMLLYPVRRLRAGWLIAVGALVLPAAMLIAQASAAFFEQARAEMPEVWAEMLRGFAPTAEDVAKETARRGALSLGLLAWNAGTAASMHLVMFPTWGLWRITGLMLIGMGLMKMGVFSAARSARFYVLMGAIGYGVGAPLVWIGALRTEAAGFDPVYIFRAGWNYNYFGSVGVALGHTAVVMLLCREGRLGALGRGLAAVGRTALSNYLLQTLICLTLFSGFGLFSRLDRVELMGVMLAIWAAQITASTAWLRAGMLYGPAEWAWRSLTYGRVQPLRGATAA